MSLFGVRSPAQLSHLFMPLVGVGLGHLFENVDEADGVGQRLGPAAQVRTNGRIWGTANRWPVGVSVRSTEGSDGE
ncbi:hypothetical protein LY78DRAFT_659626 [Colletotrichum sublineola]|nr:hypothetical protein LY78DRAFT_659626 [Colletotrichum sublineola]